MEYMKDYNQTQAAIRAGYSERSAWQISSRLMRNVEVSAYVDALMQPLKMSTDELVIRVSDAARNVGSQYFDDNGDFNFPQARADNKMHLVKGVSHTVSEKSETLKVELVDPLAALTLIGKHLKVWNEDQKPVIPSEITVIFKPSDEQKKSGS